MCRTLSLESGVEVYELVLPDFVFSFYDIYSFYSYCFVQFGSVEDALDGFLKGKSLTVAGAPVDVLYARVRKGSGFINFVKCSSWSVFGPSLSPVFCFLALAYAEVMVLLFSDNGTFKK